MVRKGLQLQELMAQRVKRRRCVGNSSREKETAPAGPPRQRLRVRRPPRTTHMSTTKDNVLDPGLTALATKMPLSVIPTRQVRNSRDCQTKETSLRQAPSVLFHRWTCAMRCTGPQRKLPHPEQTPAICRRSGSCGSGDPTAANCPGGRVPPEPVTPFSRERHRNHANAGPQPG